MTENQEQEPYGARLLQAMRQLGGISMFPYRVIQELKQADREECVRILRAHWPHATYALLQAIRTQEPRDVLYLWSLTYAPRPNITLWPGGF